MTQSGIKGIAQPVPEEVKGQNNYGDGQSRKEGQVRGVAHILPSQAEHGAPLRRRWLDAEPQKTQCCCGQYGRRYTEGALDDDRSHAVGQNVLHDDSEIAGPNGARRLHKLLPAHRECGGPNDTGVAWDLADPNRDHQVQQIGPQRPDDGDSQDDLGHGKQDVHHPHQDVVDAPTVVADDSSDKTAEDRTDAHRDKPDIKGYPCPVDDAAELVPTEIVRPDLLLLDEAFSSLDVILKLDIFKVLGTLWEAERFTLMTVTHNPRDALLTADRILILGGSPMHVLRELRLPPRVRSSSDPEVLETENQILRCLSETP